jgi:hypothetical protein
MNPDDPTPTAPESIPLPPAPFDRETFAYLCQRGAEISQLLSTQQGAILGVQLLGILQGCYREAFPDKAAKVDAALAAARKKSDDELEKAIAEAPEKYRAMWGDLHSRARKTPAGVDDTAYLNSLSDALVFKGACKNCKVSYDRYREKNPPDFSVEGAYFAWTVDLHNHVRLSQQRTTLTLAEAKLLYPLPAAV